MVFLDRIYTKGGDAGLTSLGDARRVPKTHSRIVAFGTVDELNSVLGLLRTTELDSQLDQRLQAIQNDLFDVGADLCVPEPATDAPPPEHPPLRLTAAQTERLEHWIDEINQDLEPLRSFVLPGGSPASAWLHLARTTCRRAEVAVWTLKESEPASDEVPRYLNRLSDLLFVLAQHCNDRGRSSVLWQPGAGREDG
jgi:cob(I)alamin adenosyltransferase